MLFNTKIFRLIIFCIPFLIQAQFNFVSSEIITKNGDSLTCSIKNLNPHNEIKTISYKIAEDSEMRTMDFLEISQIVVRKKKKYIIAEVNIDNSSNDLNKLEGQDRTKDFHFKKKTLLLEILVDGKHPLYRSNLDKIEKFFFIDHDQKIVQLLHKMFFWQRGPHYIGNDVVENNNFYYRQLYSEVPCLNKKNKFDPPPFKKLSLVSYFKKLNAGKCN